jgi:hypothetical protein
MWREIRSRHPEWRRREWVEAALDVLVLACAAWLVLAVLLLAGVIIWQLAAM